MSESKAKVTFRHSLPDGTYVREIVGATYCDYATNAEHICSFYDADDVCLADVVVDQMMLVEFS